MSSQMPADAKKPLGERAATAMRLPRQELPERLRKTGDALLDHIDALIPTAEAADMECLVDAYTQLVFIAREQ
jgi:hypothetical protein